MPRSDHVVSGLASGRLGHGQVPGVMPYPNLSRISRLRCAWAQLAIIAARSMICDAWCEMVFLAGP
eukprot:8026364-Alexandrium_andersonii.AAC.1